MSGEAPAHAWHWNVFILRFYLFVSWPPWWQHGSTKPLGPKVGIASISYSFNFHTVPNTDGRWAFNLAQFFFGQNGPTNFPSSMAFPSPVPVRTNQFYANEMAPTGKLGLSVGDLSDRGWVGAAGGPRPRVGQSCGWARAAGGPGPGVGRGCG